jgi:prepilin-type N-terminal cleavage/methylation domain-containing protein
LPRSRSEAGFTLIEVLAAVLIVCLVFGLLLETVTRNLRDLSRARQEARAAQVAEDRVRELSVLISSGEKIEDGVREEPCSAENADDLICQTIVAEEKLALPADYPGELSPSPLFRRANEPPRNPAPGAGQEPPLRLVQVRAYPPETDPNTVEPFVVLLVAPLDSAAQQQLQQGQQQPQNQPPGEQGNSIGGSNRSPRTRGGVNRGNGGLSEGQP